MIHQTEALVAIDVNTGRYVGREDLEETVFAANMEAAPEIARQIRLRDLGGLLVVDFIDMEDPEHRKTLFEAFEAELARDRSRTRVLQISEFGLIEITRQRSRGNLERVLTRSCPCCSGAGRVKTDLTVALDLRRTLSGSAQPLHARARRSACACGPASRASSARRACWRTRSAPWGSTSSRSRTPRSGRKTSRSSAAKLNVKSS